MIGNEPLPATVQQSPWKKPKPVVSLSKTKSLKRKSEIFTTIASNDHIDSPLDPSNSTTTSSELSNLNDFEEPSSKSRKTFSNKFSVRNDNLNGNLSNTQLNLAINLIAERNELYSFFNGVQNTETVSVKNEVVQVVSNQKINETLATLTSSMVSNFYSDNDSIKTGIKPNEEESKTYDFVDKQMLPIDWSLKTRLRFISSKTFSCNNGIKSSHESEGISNYSKFTSFYQSIEASNYNSAQANKDLFKSLFCEALNYWTFPYLPWLNLYPRNSGLANLSSMHEPLNADIQKALAKSWNQSFKSLYNSLKSNECPYFYVLTHSYIVLFRAQNVGGINDMQAILTPSTKGLRETLKDINFEMPLMPNSSRKSVETTENQLNDSAEPHNISSDMNINKENKNESNSSLNDENNSPDKNSSLTNKNNSSASKTNPTDNYNKGNNTSEDEDNENDDDSDEPDEWLEQIGLNSAVNFKSSILQRNSKNAQKESVLAFDNRPKSTLLFSQGGDVQALFNFLLNSKSCVSNSGPLTGVPPTLLSPTSFIGANLQKIKVEQNIIKSLTSTGQSLTQYALDLIGPVMPYHIHRLCHLFRLTQVDDFEMMGNTYDQTGSLNCVSNRGDKSNETECSADLKVSPFLDLSERKSMEKMFGIFGESQAIKNISFKNDTFHCSF